jgi:hypothetical protein
MMINRTLDPVVERHIQDYGLSQLARIPPGRTVAISPDTTIDFGRIVGVVEP